MKKWYGTYQREKHEASLFYAPVSPCPISDIALLASLLLLTRCSACFHNLIVFFSSISTYWVISSMRISSGVRSNSIYMIRFWNIVMTTELANTVIHQPLWDSTMLSGIIQYTNLKRCMSIHGSYHQDRFVKIIQYLELKKICAYDNTVKQIAV